MNKTTFNRFTSAAIIVISNLFLFSFQIAKAQDQTTSLTEISTSNTTATSEANSPITKKDLLTVQKDEFSIMTFNVENLFDTIHDKGTEDYTYLPLAKKKKDKKVTSFCQEMKPGFYKTQCQELDWNDEVLDAKLEQISKVIRYVNDGKGPDNVLLAEVENLRVLKMLFKKKLKNLGYKTVVLIEGPDTRGIDPAIVSKFPMMGKPKLHIIPYSDENPEALKRAKKSRGILEVVVQTPNKKSVTLLAAHFPSQSNPTQWREQALKFARSLIEKYQAEGKAVIFGGDLNIIASEDMKHGYFKQILSPVAEVSHLVGCNNCRGSHNYRGDWSFLDVLSFSSNMKDLGFELVRDSITTVRMAANVDAEGLPVRFDEKKLEGVADHLPMFAKVKFAKKK